MTMAEIVLTAPATEMSNHHGKEFLGFLGGVRLTLLQGFLIAVFGSYLLFL